MKEIQKREDSTNTSTTCNLGNIGTTSTLEGLPLKTVSDVEIREEKLTNPNFMSELVCVLTLGYCNTIQFYLGANKSFDVILLKCAHTCASGISFMMSGLPP